MTTIDEIATTFFAAFDNRNGKTPNMDALRALFIDGATIVKVVGGEAQVMTVDAFIAPREALLRGDALIDFHEWEESAQTSSFGGIAWRRCTYRKSGTMNGTAFVGAGMKVFSFALQGDRWRIASVLWQDEEEGLLLRS